MFIFARRRRGAGKRSKGSSPVKKSKRIELGMRCGSFDFLSAPWREKRFGIRIARHELSGGPSLRRSSYGFGVLAWRLSSMFRADPNGANFRLILDCFFTTKDTKTTKEKMKITPAV